MQKERFQSQTNQNFVTVCHTEGCLTFSRLAAKLSEMITKFVVISKCSLTSMTSKTARPKFLKIASNQCKSSKYWWEVWTLGRGRKKTKRPQQLGAGAQKELFIVKIGQIRNNIYQILFRFLRLWEKEETYGWRFELMSSEYWILSLHWIVQVNIHNLIYKLENT